MCVQLVGASVPSLFLVTENIQHALRQITELVCDVVAKFFFN